jgi:hypothetical protein
MSSPSQGAETPFILLLIIQVASAVQLPYNPTRILVSSQNSRQAYIFQPVSSSSSQWQLGSLDLSSQVSTTGLSISTIQSTLPFLSDSTYIPFSASIDNNGTIYVYVGDCSQPSNAQVWTFSTVKGKAWAQIKSGLLGSGVPAPQYLASSLSFSNTTSGSINDDKFYIFGGMCPSSSANGGLWTSSATYTNSTLRLSFTGTTSPQAYSGSLVSSLNAPVTQAGHSLTPLLPTYSVRADGTQTQQQNFVLLGGHTSSAFLNLSQIALYSLPQESWSYFSIPQNSASPSIDPRSGHTAVMSSDGKQVVIFGGWIGDTNTPASPQLAVLNVADGYGGSGSWQWSSPSPSLGSGFPTNGGLYGHASIMLPGDVMLITGGYSMSSSSSRLKRDSGASQVPNTNSYLYNISSNSWLNTYNVPQSAFSQIPNSQHKSIISSPAQKAGLGLGISLGVISIFVILFTFLWFKRRARWLREQREDEMRGAQGFVSDEWGVGGYGNSPADYVDNKGFDYNPPVLPPLGHIQQSRQSQPRNLGAQSTHRTSLAGDLSSSTRVVRKSVGGRSPYPYERSVRGRENIHTIAENDEEEPENQDNKNKELEMSEKEKDIGVRASIASSKDPFIDPLGSHPVKPNSRPTSGSALSQQDREQEVQSWVSGWKRAGEELMGGPVDSTGRTSPAKSDRTLSSLSSISAGSSRSGGMGGASSGVTSIVRTLSTRSAQILKLNPFGSANGSVGSASPEPISPSTPTKPLPSTFDFSAPQPGSTGFSKLQADGEILLGRQGGQARPDSSQDLSAPRRSGSTRKSYYASGSLFGSVRRAIGMGGSSATGRSTSLTATSALNASCAAASRKTPSPTQDMGISTSASMATKAAGLAPRRSASDAAFWKGKRGAKDWDADGTTEGVSGPGHGGEDGEWDVEGAAQNRVVQLMFTVPRERLRVVNADDDDARSIRSWTGDGSVDNDGF